jgi:hypothetical protein
VLANLNRRILFVTKWALKEVGRLFKGAPALAVWSAIFSRRSTVTKSVVPVLYSGEDSAQRLAVGIER